MKNKNYLFLTAAAIAFGSCTSYKPFYKYDTDWEAKKMPDLPLKYSVYLVGGIDDVQGSSSEVFTLLQQHLEKADTNHITVFLSDHIYDHGLPEENDANRKDAEKKIDSELSYLSGDKGKILFIPGDHDVIKGEKKLKETLARTHSYVENKLGRENIFLPEGNCPGPEEIHLTDDLVIVPINTQWWLHDKDERNNNCENKKAVDWVNAIKDILDNNQRKNILMLGHQPMLNAGNHGGYFSLRQHIFPLTDLQRSLYLPLPVVGSLYPLFRAGIGTKYDLAYPKIKQERRNLIAATRDYGNIIYASDHDHNFQYFKYENKDLLISNSSDDITWVGKRRADFTYSAKGFIKLSYLQNNEVWMEVFVPDQNKKEGVVVFRKKLKDKNYAAQSDSIQTASNVSFADSSITISADPSLKAGKFVRFFLGDHYRDAWTTPVKVPLLDLSHEQGGLEIVKKGGGFQTKSLRLQNPEGKEFAVRSVIKYPERLLGKEMLNTFAADIVKDQASSTHPYAPYVVDDLSEAAGIFHSNPKMVYIPNDNKLGEFKGDFANTLALFEQRADGKLTPSKNFGNAYKAISSYKLMDKLREDNDSRVDQYSLLKSRLFDMWINDWDRHEDQWRWGAVECNADNADYCKKLKAKDKYYVAIPRDRDQAFAKFDGVFPWIAGRKWALRKFQDFKNDIRDVPGFNFNARNFDHAFLTELSREDWNRIASELKAELTDQKIEHSIKQFPEAIYKLDGEKITSILKARRDKIPSFADRYYNYLSQYVDVTGSDKKEIFEITRMNDESTSVKMYDQEKGEKGRLLYDRTFNTGETKEVRIYGMGGADIFNVSGNVNKGIVIRIIGGDGKDSITDASHVSGWCKKTRIYDDKNKNIISFGSEAKDLTSKSKSVNEYDYYSYQYNVVAPATFFGYNTDDGIFLGGGVMIRRQGFRKKPYASYQRIVGNVAINDGSFNFKYTGDFNKVFGKWGINTNFSILAPKSTTNFFGLGNDTKLLDIPDIFYRVRYDEVYAYPALRRHIGKYHSIKIGPVYEYIKIENTPGRYLNSPEGLPYIQDFTSRNFGGGKFEYEIQNIDDTVMTLRGIKWTTSVTSQSEFKNSSLHPTNIESQLSLYIPLPNHSTLAIRAGGATIAGDFEFYQANSLGGQNAERGSGNLRGYLRGRYAGRSMAYLNADLRIRLLAFRTYLFPAHLGLLGFYDQGKVWIDDQTSNIWHTGYGGGVWIDPFGMAVINVTYAISKEEKLYSVGLGFLF